MLQLGNTNPLIGPFNQYSPGGACCRNGFRDCNGQANDGCEVDIMNDEKNCGCCSVESPLGSGTYTCRCGDNEMCKAGKCGCRFGFKPCMDGLKPKCIPKDTCCPASQATDCPGQHDHCSGVGGQCMCDVDPTGETVWADCVTDNPAAPETMGCETDLQTSDQHCGACGNDCGCAKRCEEGDCVCDTPNYGNCNEDATLCFDLSLDAHCGPDCEECDKGRQCQWDGATQQWGCACPDGPTPDSFLTDPLNCGSCGHACNVTAGETCNAGVCKCQEGKKLCGDAGCQACCVDADCGDPLLRECDTISNPASYACKDKCLYTSCTDATGAVDCCDDEAADNPAICIEDKCAYCAAPKHWCDGSCVDCCGDDDCLGTQICGADHTCHAKCLSTSCTDATGAVDCCGDEAPDNPAICIEDKCAYCKAPNHWCDGACVECCGDSDCDATEFCAADHTCKPKCLTVSCTDPTTGETECCDGADMINPYCDATTHKCTNCASSVCGPTTCCPAGAKCVSGSCEACGGGPGIVCDANLHQIYNFVTKQCECAAGYNNCGTTTLDCQKCCAPQQTCGDTCCDTSKGQTCDSSTNTCVCASTLKNCATNGLDCKACCSPLCEGKDLLGIFQSKCCDDEQPNVGCYPEKGEFCGACAAGYRFCPDNPELGCSRCCPGTNAGCPDPATGQYVCERSADDQPYDCVLNGCHLFATCIENQTPSGNSHVCKIKQNDGQGDCDACTADNNLPCPEDYVCDNGKCKYAKRCDEATICPHGFSCTTGVCTVVATCATTADCPMGLTCDDKKYTCG